MVVCWESSQPSRVNICTGHWKFMQSDSIWWPMENYPLKQDLATLNNQWKNTKNRIYLKFNVPMGECRSLEIEAGSWFLALDNHQHNPALVSLEVKNLNANISPWSFLQDKMEKLAIQMCCQEHNFAILHSIRKTNCVKQK